jgi:hypothetical protein
MRAVQWRDNSVRTGPVNKAGPTGLWYLSRPGPDSSSGRKRGDVHQHCIVFRCVRSEKVFLGEC